MMKSFINECKKKGIALSIGNNGKLKISGNKQALSNDLTQKLKEHKVDILQILKKEQLETFEYEFQNGIKNKSSILSRLKITADEIVGIYPLVPLQESMLLHHIYDKNKDPYITYFSVKVNDKLKLDRMIEGFKFISQRHASCRTQIVWQGVERSYQLVRKQGYVPVNYVDCQNEVEVNEKIEHFKSDARPFNLEVEPLLRITVFQQMDIQQFTLYIERHHIVSDHTSLEITLRELLQFINGEHDDLPEVNQQYQYALELDKNGLPDHRYFDNLLAGFVKPSLLFDLETKQVDISKFEYIHRSIPCLLNDKIRQLSKDISISPASFFHLAWAVVLSHHCGQNDVLFASVFSGRFSASNYRQTVGMFLNSLPFRVTLDGQSASEHLKAINLQLMQAYQYEQVPLEQSIQSLNRKFSTVFNSVLNYRHSAEDETVSQLPFNIIETQDKSSIPFTMCISDTHKNFNLELKAYQNFCGDELVNDLIIVLERLTQDVEMQDSAEFVVPMLSQAFAKNVQGSHDDLSEPQDCLNHLFEQFVLNNPDKVAAVCGQQSITFKELDDKANQLATHLKANYQTTSEQLIGLCVNRSIEMLVGIIGILKAGCAYVPLDPQSPQNRLEYMVDDASLTLVIAQKEYNNLFKRFNGDMLYVDGILSDEYFNSSGQREFEKVDVRPNQLAYVIYTSGSTGKPKGVMVEHRNVTRLLSVTENNYEFSPNDVWTMFHSYAFDFSVWEIFGALCSGAKLVIVPYQVSRTPKDFLRLLAKERVTVLNQTPSAFTALISENDLTTELLSLRYVIFGGEKLKFDSLLPWINIYGDESPKLVNMYGITETTVHVTYQHITKDIMSNFNGKSIIGKPLNDLTVVVRNKDGSATPLNQPGELYVGGAGVTRGYLNRDELTSERFIFDQHSGERLYKTGDIVKLLNDGSLEYLGRNDNQVKIRGFRIELGEIEAELEQLADIDSANVVASQFDSGVQLIGYVKLNNHLKDINIDECRDSIRQKLSMQLPSYMVPGFILFVESWPLTNNGKLDVSALPLPKDAMQCIGIVPPETNMEKYIVRKVGEIAGVNAEQLSITESLLNFGFNSILSLRLSQSLSAEFNINNPLSLILEANNIKELAMELELISSIQGPEEVIEDAIEEEW